MVFIGLSLMQAARCNAAFFRSKITVISISTNAFSRCPTIVADILPLLNN
jgi:hypothetical protein